MIPGSNSGFISAAAEAYLIEQSLLFDGTAYLNRTPSSAGNRKTWTFSCWIKRGELGVSDTVFSAGDGGSNYSRINFQADNTLIIVAYTGASAVYNYQTSAAFRDTSAWYHIVVQQGQAAGAVALWVNGVSVALNELTQKPLNYSGYINNTFDHSVGKLSNLAAIYSGLIALPILVDGSALGPTSFGETDADGFWNPIEFVPDTVGSNLTANYVTSVSNDGGGGFATSPVTFSSVDIGTASATRKVIVGVGMDGYQGNEAYTSLTIGGVAANLIQEQNAASGGRPVALYELDVASGTSADIVVTFTGTQTKCYSMGIGVWTIEGGTLFSTVGSTADPGVGDINVPAGGTVIAIMTEGSAAATYTWANLTENFDNQVRASRHAFSGASKNLSSYTTQAISANVSGGSQFAMLAASFAPAGGYGTNGFQLDYADNTLYGLDVKDGDAAAAYTISASGLWTGGSITYTGDSIQGAAGDEAAYVTSSVSSANFPANFSAVPVGTLDNAGSTTGLFDAAEIGTFNAGDTGGNGGLDNMTKSWSIRHSDGQVRYGSSVVATVAVALNTEIKWDIAADGTVTVFGSTTSHTFTQKADGISIHWAFGVSNPSRVLENVRWIDSASGTVGNNFRGFNFTTTDQLEDTPTDSANDGIGNFSTLDPNFKQGTSTLSEGNLKIASSSGWGGFAGTIGMDSGKYYWEQSHVGTVAGNFNMGVCRTGVGTSTSITGNAFVAVYEAANNFRANGSNLGNFTPSVTTDCIIGWAYDADARKLWMAVDNTFVNLASAGTGNPATGANPTATISGTDSVFALGQIYNASSSKYAEYNFGQKPFAYTPPTGYVALATQNLPSSAPLYTGTAAQYRVGAPIINPFTDLPNAVHGWRADLGLTLTGSSVDQWDDQIGSWNLVDGGTKPTVLSSNINGLDAISFPGDGGNLSISGVTLTMPYTMLMVMKQITWSLYGYPFGVFTQKGLQQRSSTPQLMQGDNLANTNSAATVGSYFPIMAEFGNTTSDFLHIGDTRVGGTASGDSSISNSSFMLGAAQSSPPANRSANVAYAEFIIVEGAMSEFDLANYRAYVKSRYGV